MRSKVMQDILDSMSEDELLEMNEHFSNIDMQHMQEWHNNYGKDTSLLLKKVQESGFDPIAITVMMCEETFVFKTQEEAKLASDIFMPEGFWYGLDQFITNRIDYVNEIYDGKSYAASPIYWLDKLFEQEI